jgi:hypothetical protein
MNATSKHRLQCLVAATLLTVGVSVWAQSPTPTPSSTDTPKGERRGKHGMRCDQASDKAQCEARHQDRYAAHEKAREACKASPEAERAQCMSKQLCANAKDPARCEAWASQRAKDHDRHHGGERGERGERGARRDGAAPVVAPSAPGATSAPASTTAPAAPSK